MNWSIFEKWFKQIVNDNLRTTDKDSIFLEKLKYRNILNALSNGATEDTTAMNCIYKLNKWLNLE